jgi:N-acyl-L-homoserine lactone synthetase
MDVSEIVDEISRTERQFTSELVRRPEQLREVFRLRHQVYCVERGFETSEHGEETDEFDHRSRHVLLRHANDGEVVGTVRVIAANPTHPGASFPTQRLCETALLRHLPLHTTGEISRFAISKQRRMSCTSAVLLRLALLRGIVQVSHEMGLTHWLAVMERSLLRLLQRNAIHFDPVGPLVAYHGIRQPTSGTIAAMLGRIRREQFEIWHFLTQGGRWCGQPQSFARAA